MNAQRFAARVLWIVALAFIPAVAVLVDGCSFAESPFVYNNPLDPNPTLDSAPANRSITVDGATADWEGVNPVLSDPRGDVSSPTTIGGMDIKTLYLAEDGSYLYFRFDLWNPPVDPNVHYEFTISQFEHIPYVNYGIWVDNGNAGAWQNQYDTNGNFAGQITISGTSCSSGTVIEGNFPLSFVAGQNNLRGSAHANYVDSGTGQLISDDLGDFILAF